MTPHDEQFIRSQSGTPQEVVAARAALPPLTQQAIPLKSLGEYLREVGLMAALKAVAADTNQNAMLRAGIADFLDQLADVRAVNLDTSNVRIAVRSAAVLAGLAPVAEVIGLVPSEVTAAIYALGGGLRYSTITEADVLAVRAADELEAARDEKRAALDALSAEIDAALPRMQSVREAAIVSLNEAETLEAVAAVAVPTLADAVAKATE